MVDPDGPVWVCATCGNHVAAPSPPALCPICADERQWLPPDGQRWTTLIDLAHTGHRTIVRGVEPDLVGIGVDPPLAIGQRALLVRTNAGNLLWDPPGFLDDRAASAVERAGGIHAVSASHPHFYGAATEWARRFDAEVVLPAVDAHWLRHPAPRSRTWAGTDDLLPGVTLVQCGGHFPGSAVVHWAAGADGAGALLTGDTLLVTPGEDRVTFVYSAPNRLPLPAAAVRGVVAALEPFAFERIYAGWWEPVLRRDAKAAVARSAARYLAVLDGDVPA